MDVNVITVYVGRWGCCCCGQWLVATSGESINSDWCAR